MKLIINVRDGNSIISSTKLNTDSQAAIFHTSPQAPLQVEFLDPTTGQAAHITQASRNGYDLELTFEGSEQPDVIFKDYYTLSDLETPELVGRGENGRFYHYKIRFGNGNESGFSTINENAVAKEIILTGAEATRTVASPFLLTGVGLAAATAAAVGITQIRKDNHTSKTKPASTDNSTGTTTDNQGSTDNGTGTTTDNQGSTDNGAGTTTDNQGSTDNGAGTTTDNQGTTDNGTGENTDNQGSTDNGTGATTDNQGSTDNGTGENTDNQGSTDNGAGENTDNQGTTDNGTGENTDNQGSTDNGAGTTTDNQGSTDNGAGTTTDNQGSTDNGTGTNTDNQGTTDNGAGENTDNQGSTDNGAGTTTDNQGSTDNGTGENTDNQGATDNGTGTNTDNQGSTDNGTGTTTDNQGSTDNGSGENTNNQGSTDNGVGENTDNQGSTDNGTGENTDNQGSTDNGAGTTTDNQGSTDNGAGTTTDNQGSTDNGTGENTGNQGSTDNGTGTTTDNQGSTDNGTGENTDNQGSTDNGTGENTDNQGSTDNGAGENTDNQGSSDNGAGENTDNQGSTDNGTGENTDNQGSTDNGTSENTDNQGSTDNGTGTTTDNQGSTDNGAGTTTDNQGSTDNGSGENTDNQGSTDNGAGENTDNQGSTDNGTGENTDNQGSTDNGTGENTDNQGSTDNGTGENTDNQGATDNGAGENTDNQGSTDNGTGTTTDNQGSTDNGAGTNTDNQGSTDNGTGTNTDNQGSTDNGAGTTTDNQGSTDNGTGTTTDNQGSTDNGTGESTDNQGSTDNGTGENTDNQGSTDNGAGTTTDNQGSTDNGAGTNTDNQGSTDNGTGTTTDNQGSTDNRAGENTDNQENTETPTPPKPEPIEVASPSVQQGRDAGSVLITAGENNERLKISFIDENNQKNTLEIAKNSSGLWQFLSDTPQNIELDNEAGQLLFTPNSLLDGSSLTIEAGILGQKPTEVQFVAGNDSVSHSPQVANGTEAGAVVITPHSDNVRVEVSYRDEQNTQHTLIIEKNSEGKWQAITPITGEISLNPANGVLDFAPDSLLDGSTLQIIGFDLGNSASGVQSWNAGTDISSHQPTLVIIERGELKGGAQATPHAKNSFMRLNFVDEHSVPQVLEIEKVGERWNWVGEAPTQARLDSQSGMVTLLPDAVADNTVITLTARNGNNPESEPVSNTTIFDNASDSPIIEAGVEPGSMQVTPHQHNALVRVSYVREDGFPAILVAVKNDDGSWALNNNQVPVGVAFNSETGVILLDPEEVRDLTFVKAVAENGSSANGQLDPVSPEVSLLTTEDRQSEQPSITEGREQGSAVITPGEGNTKLVFAYVDELNTQQVLVVNKTNGVWQFTNFSVPADVLLDARSGQVTLPAQAVKDKTQVTAVGAKGNNPESEKVNFETNDDTQSLPPTVEQGSKAGSVVITPKTTHNYVRIEYTDENGTAKTVELVKRVSTWAVQGITPSGSELDVRSGRFVLDSEQILDNSTVYAQGQGNRDPMSNKAEVQVSADPQSSEPVIGKGETQGSIQVTPLRTHSTLIVDFVNEQDAQVQLTAKKTANRWQIQGDTPQGVSIDSVTGKIVFEATALKDLSLVKAKAQTNTNPVSNEVSEQAAENPQSSEPLISKGEGEAQGSVQVTPLSEHTSLVVDFINEQGSTLQLIAKKTANLWQIQGDTPQGVSIDANTGKVILEATAVQDQSLVKAKAQSGSSPFSKEVSTQADDNPVLFTKLTLTLEEDTGTSAQDNYTNNPNIILSGVPQGAQYEYSIDAGYSWTQAVNSNGGDVIFRLPDNGKAEGQRHIVKARIVNKAGEYDADPISVTYDHTINNRIGFAGDQHVLWGIGEQDSRNKLWDNQDRELGEANVANDHSQPFKERFRMEVSGRLAVSPGGTKYNLVTTDKAGNTQTQSFIQHTDIAVSSEAQTNRLNNVFTEDADALYVGGTFSFLSALRNTGTTGLQFKGGNDVLIYQDTVDNARINMGGGHDFLSLGGVEATQAKPVTISMGEGNDVLSIGQPFTTPDGSTPSYMHTGMFVNFSSGDDTLVLLKGALLDDPVNVDIAGKGELYGGSGFDTIVFMPSAPANGGENKIGSWNGIEEFEKIDIRGSLHVNDLSIDVLRNNHSKQLIDDSGVAHQGVFIIDGDRDDKVSFVKTGVTQVKGKNITYESKQYETYSYDSDSEHYEVWVQQGIQVL